jgi:hypothetical protein
MVLQKERTFKHPNTKAIDKIQVYKLAHLLAVTSLKGSLPVANVMMKFGGVSELPGTTLLSRESL